MVTTSDFDGGRRTVSFDRVELGGGNFPEHPFELSQQIDLTGDGLPTVTWIYDRECDAVTWSSPIEEFFGFPTGIRGFSIQPGTPDEQPAALRPPVDFGSPTDIGSDLLAPILAPIRAGVLPSEFDLHYTVTCPDGTIRVAVIRASPMPVDREHAAGGTLGSIYTGVVIDVTAQQRFERELSDLVDRYRLLTEVSPDVVIVHQDGLLVYGNRAGVKLLGAKSMWDHYGHPVTDYVHPTDIKGMIERLAQLTEPGQFFEHGEVRVVAPDGTSTVMELTSIRTTWGGKPAYQVIMRDVSERRAAEAAARYRASLVAHVSDAIIGIDAEGRIESWNEAAQHIYGWSEDEVAGLSIGTVVSANRTDSAAILERGQHDHRRKDGSTVDVLVSIDPLMDDDTLPS
ncbi:MAG TPA: PAS domain S-box protein, partial [Acidimicrobiales bacterium]